MSRMPKSTRRTLISKHWQPTKVDAAYAAAHGFDDPAPMAEAFRDYHMSHGTLMKDWAAAWRTWCRNQRKWAKAPKPTPVIDPSDPYGIKAFVESYEFADRETFNGVADVPSINGFDLAGVLLDVCLVARLPTDWRGDLQPVAEWLRDDIHPDHIIDVIRSCAPTRKPGSWWAYQKRVRA